jgi:hypothetical protein
MLGAARTVPAPTLSEEVMQKRKALWIEASGALVAFMRQPAVEPAAESAHSMC